MNDAALKLLDYQRNVMGNVAAGMLAASWRVHGAWTLGQHEAFERIKRDIEASKRRAQRIIDEKDEVKKAEVKLDEVRERLERLKKLRARSEGKLDEMRERMERLKQLREQGVSPR